jgi:euchromatic histone-lysine N-methyltransferase
MDSVAVMEVAPVPDPPFIDATPLPPPAPLAALVLRRSARCLNRPTKPSYAEREPPKQPGGRGRGKRKRDEEKQEQAAAAEEEEEEEEGAKSPGRKAEAGEGKPMPPVVAAVPVSCAGVAPAAAAEDDGTGTGKSAKLRVKETLRAFNSHYLHFVQVASLCVWMHCLFVKFVACFRLTIYVCMLLCVGGAEESAGCAARN